MTFVRGHLIFGLVQPFPHLCPGQDCAIARWLAARATKTAYVTREAPPHLKKPDGKPLAELIAELL